MLESRVQALAITFAITFAIFAVPKGDSQSQVINEQSSAFIKMVLFVPLLRTHNLVFAKIKFLVKLKIQSQVYIFSNMIVRIFSHSIRQDNLNEL